MPSQPPPNPALSRAGQLIAQKIADGVWFLPGDASKGYCNNIVIEMRDYLIVVDANYPGRARELVSEISQLSPKPVRFVFDTHAHRDHAYGNIVWTEAGATTFAYQGVADEMDRYEPNAGATLRPSATTSAPSTSQMRPAPSSSSVKAPSFSKTRTREVRFYFLGWAHTRGDGFVWLPKERILCTGDAAVNGPHNKLWDANIENWPRVLAQALAFQPLHVLPGHGDAGGPEILTGQQVFLQDLFAAVKQQVDAGKTLAQIDPDPPRARPQLDPQGSEHGCCHRLRGNYPAPARRRPSPRVEVTPGVPPLRSQLAQNHAQEPGVRGVHPERSYAVDTRLCMSRSGH